MLTQALSRAGEFLELPYMIVIRYHRPDYTDESSRVCCVRDTLLKWLSSRLLDPARITLTLSWGTGGSEPRHSRVSIPLPPIFLPSPYVQCLFSGIIVQIALLRGSLGDGIAGDLKYRVQAFDSCYFGHGWHLQLTTSSLKQPLFDLAVVLSRYLLG